MGDQLARKNHSQVWTSNPSYKALCFWFGCLQPCCSVAASLRTCPPCQQTQRRSDRSCGQAGLLTGHAQALKTFSKPRGDTWASTWLLPGLRSIKMTLSWCCLVLNRASPLRSLAPVFAERVARPPWMPFPAGACRKRVTARHYSPLSISSLTHRSVFLSLSEHLY